MQAAFWVELLYKTLHLNWLYFSSRSVDITPGYKVTLTNSLSWSFLGALKAETNQESWDDYPNT